jgi:SAM-dependent methyltransferase
MTSLGIDASFTTVFSSALQGHACLVLEGDQPASLLPMDAWRREADAGDEAVLRQCSGPTLDIGCGPGRMAQSLARRGSAVLGIDVVPEAVQQSLDRGVAALVRNVFDHVPGEGRWETALLADGNIGIGGDPIALLTRVRELLAPTGRAVVDVAPPGAGVVTRQVRIETVHGRSPAFSWTSVGADAIEAVARAAGFQVEECHSHGERWYAVLTPTAPQAALS